MPLPVRLLALPVGTLLTVAIVGLAAPPQSDAVAPVRTAAADVSTSCGAGAASAMTAARDRGVAYSFLRGSTFAAKATSIGDRTIALPGGTTTLRDFVAGKERIDSARIGAAATGVVGLGSGESTMALEPHSSTRKSAVPTKEYVVNPVNVLRVSAAHAVVGGFTLTGSDQGHTYNGLRIERSTSPQVDDVHVVGIPGDMDRPPGETFGINDYKTVGAHYSHVEVDGAGVGAAGFAANGSQGITVCDSSSHDNPVSMGFAFWSVKDITLVNCTAIGNGFTGFNFERVSGTVTLINPVAQDNRWDMRVVSDTSNAHYQIVDPDLTHTQVPGKWTVEVPSTYWQHPSKQKTSDIELIVDGKKRPDLLRLVRPY